MLLRGPQQRRLSHQCDDRRQHASAAAAGQVLRQRRRCVAAAAGLRRARPAAAVAAATTTTFTTDGGGGGISSATANGGAYPGVEALRDAGGSDAYAAAAAAAASWQRKTKLVCTIGPATASREDLFRLCDAGMNVARLNMSHGSHESHRQVVDMVREYNATGRGCVATMLDTKGPEVRSGDLAEPLELAPGDRLTFTVREGANGKGGVVSVNYDGFIDDVSVGDELLVDGGILSFRVVGKTELAGGGDGAAGAGATSGGDVLCEVVDGGVMESRRHLNVRGKSATLPAITDKDRADLQFGVDVGVDFFALSFVKDAQVIREVKAWLAERGSKVRVLAKVESADSVKHLEEILDAVDGAMVARGDLGAELPVEEVPFWQSKIVQGCRRRGKPCIVATNMLESMVLNPAPTRAEVSDIAIAVREGADAVMLSGETAYGRFPLRAVGVQATVAMRTETAMARYHHHGGRRFGNEEAPPIEWIARPGSPTPAGLTAAGVVGGVNSGAGTSLSDVALSEMFAYHSTTMANTVDAPLLVFSRHGGMPALLSHWRPNRPIFAATDDPQVARHLALYCGVVPLLMKFTLDGEQTYDAAMAELARRGYVAQGQLVALVQSGRRPIWRSASTHTIQVRRVEARHLGGAANGGSSSVDDD